MARSQVKKMPRNGHCYVKDNLTNEEFQSTLNTTINTLCREFTKVAKEDIEDAVMALFVNPQFLANFDTSKGKFADYLYPYARKRVINCATRTHQHEDIDRVEMAEQEWADSHMIEEEEIEIARRALDKSAVDLEILRLAATEKRDVMANYLGVLPTSASVIKTRMFKKIAQLQTPVRMAVKTSLPTLIYSRKEVTA